jgi:hypothetical protein
MEKYLHSPGIREIGYIGDFGILLISNRSLDRAWTVVKSELQKVAGQHSVVASELRYQVAGTLNVYAENETEVKKLLNEGKVAMNDIKQAESKVQQAKEKFDKATKDEQKLQQSLDKASQKSKPQQIGKVVT